MRARHLFAARVEDNEISDEIKQAGFSHISANGRSSSAPWMMGLLSADFHSTKNSAREVTVP